MTETTFRPTDGQIARLAGAYGLSKGATSYARGGIGFLTEPWSGPVHRDEAAGTAEHVPDRDRVNRALQQDMRRVLFLNDWPHAELRDELRHRVGN